MYIFENAVARAEAFESDRSTRLRIGYLTVWSVSQFLPAILEMLHNDFPYLNIELASFTGNELEQLLIHDRVDLAFTIDDPKKKTDETTRVEIYDVKMCCSSLRV